MSAGVDASHATTGVSEGTAEVLAGQTAELFHEPSGDVRLVSDSGHDYAAQEPGQPTLLALAAAVVALRSGLAPWRSRRLVANLSALPSCGKETACRPAGPWSSP